MWLTFANSGLTKALCLAQTVGGTINLITRSTPEGDCVVKQCPQFFQDISAVMQSLSVPYNCTGIGKATLQAIEILMKPKKRKHSRGEQGSVSCKTEILMCAVWDAVAECFVRNPSSASNMRVARESDYDPLPALSSRDVFRGCTSWEHFQYPEQVLPARSQIFQESASARTPRPQAFRHRGGTHLAT